ncbi:MAG TPA: dTDP-4-dehydrorhamnose reductase [Methyloceanibacter sp.]|jgi:dTDP-4-dehydrorhamnose reductase|nr:dTDP-4-dehydrorhamnose reductase [Methyloceanibacter sp.]
MRILITGATGQLGFALASRLQVLGTLIATDRTALDLSQPNSIKPRLDQLAPELIINAAAYTAVDKAEDEQDLARIVNAEAPGMMAIWAAARNVPLIHISTDYVFGRGGERPWREDDKPVPLSAYGASKLAGEEAVRTAGGDTLIVRTSWVYAVRGTNFLCTIARLAQERPELRVVADQIGAPTSAAILADAVARMLNGGTDSFRASAAKSSGLVHFAASGETSWHGFAEAIVKGLRARDVPLMAERVVSIATEDYPTPAKRPANSRLDLERLRTVFGINPAPWQEALAPELDQLAQLLENKGN